jgi:C4-dicarboxylate-specific signal transduction histidine kinase
LWGEHKWLIVSGLAVLLSQAITIAGLVTQRMRRQRAESEIQRQRTELAHVARVSTMGQLASSLAHELNQPLGAILRNAEAGEMLLQSEKPDLKELRAIVTDIRKDDQRAAMVIDRMRALLKRRGLGSNRLNSRDWLEDTIALARPDAAARKVNLRLELAPDLPEVRGDRVHLQQVLLNLLLNGMDAMEGLTNLDRQVIVHAEEIGNGSLEVTVTDCGTGIQGDKVSQVFEPFFTTKPEGLGMGLAISKTIIEAHGGTIRAQNNARRGATFTFTLPAA